MDAIEKVRLAKGLTEQALGVLADMPNRGFWQYLGALAITLGDLIEDGTEPEPMVEAWTLASEAWGYKGEAEQPSREWFRETLVKIQDLLATAERAIG